MQYQVTEVPNAEDAKNRKLSSWTYNLSGPRLETITGFWEYLKTNKVIEDYEVEEV